MSKKADGAEPPQLVRFIHLHHRTTTNHYAERIMAIVTAFLIFLSVASSPALLLALSSSSSSSSSSSFHHHNHNHNNGDEPNAFSLKSYQTARALETTKALDASRLHFQILFVDDDNAKGRIAEGLLERVAEYNDALFILFPASATLDGSQNAPRDAAASDAATAVCSSLGLCPSRSTLMGTAFDLTYLDEYDLVIAMDDEIRSLLLRSLTSVADQEYYAPKCRLLSEFLSPTFCNIHQHTAPTTTTTNNSVDDHTSTSTAAAAAVKGDDDDVLLDMLDDDLRAYVAPVVSLLTDRSSDVVAYASVVTKDGWALAEAALILAAAGVTRFCLDAMDTQFDTAFQSLLDQHFHSLEHCDNNKNNDNNNDGNELDESWAIADDQLRRSSSSVTGYFSPEQRKRRYERHIADLRVKLLLADNK